MTESFSLEQKVIVVAGGTGVLGEAFVQSIVKAGGAVASLGRNAAVAQQRATAVEAQGGRAIAVVADVLDEDQLHAACQQVLAAFGRIDGLVNGAGGNTPDAVLEPTQGAFDLNLTGMKRLMDLNLWGTILPTQVFGLALAESGGGSIVNISSMTAQRAVTKVLGYSMGKAAVDCYSRWMAVELANRYGDKLRLNALVPGFFLTEQNCTLLTTAEGNCTERGEKVIRQTPFKRFGRPDELQGALVWLLSDASRFVTGSVISVDGGFSIFSGV